MPLLCVKQSSDKTNETNVIFGFDLYINFKYLLKSVKTKTINGLYNSQPLSCLVFLKDIILYYRLP